MNIIPELHLGKHPKFIKDGSIINADNCKIDNNNIILSTDNAVVKDDEFYNNLTIIVPNNNKDNIEIVHSIVCNNEIVLLVKGDANNLHIIRYDEINNKFCYCGESSYYGGKFVSSYTYNYNHLIVSFSEYDGTKSEPLKVIDLGKFGDKCLDKDKHYQNPIVKIPSCECNVTAGATYKGWYYIFIRYKLSEDNYTQWFNTNASVFVDYFEEKKIIQSYITKATVASGIMVGQNGTPLYSGYSVSQRLSNDSDICNNTFVYKINDIDNSFDEYQIGFILKTKTSNKAFRTEDIKINHTEFKFNAKACVEYSIDLLIRDNIVPYNTKAITSYKNALYIANYEEYSDKLNVKDLDIEITLNKTVINYDNNSKGEGNEFTGEGTIVINPDTGETEEVQPGNEDYNKITVNKNISSIVCDSVHIMPNEYYNFYVHFVNKYGEITKGYNLSEFKNIVLHNPTDTEHFTNAPKINQFTNNIGNILLNINNKTVLDYKFILDFKLTGKINIEDYIGYYISYEQFEPTIKYRGLVNINNGFKYSYSDEARYMIFYSNDLIINDKLSLDFDTIDIYGIKYKVDIKQSQFREDSSRFDYITLRNVYNRNECTSKESFIGSFPITDKVIHGYDTRDNILRQGNIYLTIPRDIPNVPEVETNNYYAAILYSSNYKTLYTKNTKQLIPCSKINYNLDKEVNVNTKTAFSSSIYNTMYIDNVIFNDTTKLYSFIRTGELYYKGAGNDAGLKTYANAVSNNIVINPLYILRYYFDVPLPYESCVINYTNTREFIPYINGDAHKAKLLPIIKLEVANLGNYYKNPNLTYYEGCPKISINHTNNDFNNKFTQTIRRSDIISDESRTIYWRDFGYDNYKNIIENKGDIIKLTAIGSMIIVHCQKSIFIYDANNTLKSNGKDVELADNDIWDIAYKELITSNYNEYGIEKENHAIHGNFGYIFFNNEYKTFYNFNNGKISRIDDNVNDYIRLSAITDVQFIDDTRNSRLLLALRETNELLSYNYKYNVFVSKHSNIDMYGISGNKNVYFITPLDSNITTMIHKFDYNKFNSNVGNTVTVLTNTNIEDIKMLEYIQYRIVNKIKELDIFSNQNIKAYPIDIIRIDSEFGTTNDLDVLVNENILFNSVQRYQKPYWELGSWNFNYIRNNITDDTISDNKNRLYGNWFAITFKVSPNATDNKVLFETISTKTVKNIT